MDAPIFIVGANRSGTTLLRLLLNAHSRIAIPDELIYFNSFLAGVPIEAWREPGLSAEPYRSFVHDFLHRAAPALPGLDLDAVQEDVLAGPHDFRRPYALVLEAWARHHDTPRWGEKTPGNLFYADVILEMFPSARFIYMVRDPRGGVASMQKVSFFPDDVVFNALSRRKHATTGRRILERNVPAPQRMSVRYEDLVTHPEATVRSVCAFLDEPFEPSMLYFHRDAEAYMKDEAASDYNAAATAPISADKVDTWTDRLSPDAVAVVEHICCSEMQAFDYDPVAPSLPLRRQIETVVKTAYWNVQCWRHRNVRHYTVKHPMFARLRR